VLNEGADRKIGPFLFLFPFLLRSHKLFCTAAFWEGA